MIPERAIGLPMRTPELGIVDSGVLLPKALEFYTSTLTTELQQIYEAGNNAVIRMEGLRAQGFVPEGVLESNHDHIMQSLEMAKEYKEKYPQLGEVIDFEIIQIMILMHDCGEFVIGDIQPVERSKKQERLKAIESFVAQKKVLALIPDKKMREEAIELYRRYNRNDPKDSEVQMARFIDKAQGTTRVAETVFNVRENPDKAIVIANHLWQTVPRMMEPANNLLYYLDEKNSNALQSIIDYELGLLGRFGPRYVATTFMNGIK
jgi:5'-deoxynucleotidase YfbR-like HD superfamily hydrolase